MGFLRVKYLYSYFFICFNSKRCYYEKTLPDKLQPQSSSYINCENRWIVEDRTVFERCTKRKTCRMCKTVEKDSRNRQKSCG